MDVCDPNASPSLPRLTTQVFYAYTYSTSAWLALQSAALISVPQGISAMLLDETRPASRKALAVT